MLCGADYHQAAERIQRTRSKDPGFLVPSFFYMFPRFRRPASELFTTLATVLQRERHLRFNYFSYLQCISYFGALKNARFYLLICASTLQGSISEESE